MFGSINQYFWNICFFDMVFFDWKSNRTFGITISIQIMWLYFNFKNNFIKIMYGRDRKGTFDMQGLISDRSNTS